MSVVEDEGVVNTSSNETFREVVDARMSRRGLIGGSIASAAVLSGVGSLVSAVPARAHDDDDDELLGFEGIPVSSADAVVVPPGYTARVLIAWGDPVSDGPAFAQDASNSAADQAQQWGMHNDGVVYFPIKGSNEGLLVQNSEYTDDVLLFPDGTANWNAEKTAKSQNAHGVNIIHIRRRRRRDEWEVVRPSRVRPADHWPDPMDIGGPVAGDPLDDGVVAAQVTPDLLFDQCRRLRSEHCFGAALGGSSARRRRARSPIAAHRRTPSRPLAPRRDRARW